MVTPFALSGLRTKYPSLMNHVYSRRSPQIGSCEGPRTWICSVSSRMYCCSFFQFSSRLATTFCMKASRSLWEDEAGADDVIGPAMTSASAAVSARFVTGGPSRAVAGTESIRRTARGISCGARESISLLSLSMPHVPLLVNIGLVLVYALAGGLVARRVGLPTIVGYLVAGMALGPFTPGFRGDPEAIGQLAELGVILLMFGVGLHFTFEDLWQVRQVAIPGALLQMIVVTIGGYLLGRWAGWSIGGSWILGMALSVASTVVMLRAMMDAGWLKTPYGKLAVGWLVFEDLVTVAILVLLPAVAAPGTQSTWLVAALAIGKAALFIVLMLFVGGRVMPFLLGHIVHMRSRELFVLLVLAMAVGTALVSSALFGVSL